MTNDATYGHLVDLARDKAKHTGKSQEMFKLNDGGYKVQERGLPWPEDAQPAAPRLFPAYDESGMIKPFERRTV